MTSGTMTAGLRTVAVVLAGGSGVRVGPGTPKQLLSVAGQTVLEHTVEALQACPGLDEILVVMAAAHLPVAQELLDRPGLSKLTRLVAGGHDRNASTRLALAELGDQDCNVLFHDAVRPLVSQRILRDCITALHSFLAVAVAIPSSDTIVRVDPQDTIVDIPDRQWLRRMQTPQGFRLSVIRRAYELAAAEPDLRTTDDCAVVLRCLPDVPIHVVRGDEQNLKVTYPVDLVVLDALLQAGTQPTQQ